VRFKRSKPLKQRIQAPAETPSIHEDFYREGDLRQIFHADNPTALDIDLVRLSVLYEDLRIGQSPMLENANPALSGIRILYFFRRALATLNEFGEVLRRINEGKDSSLIRSRFNRHELNAWNAAVAHFLEFSGKKGKKKAITAIRDDIGGHFGEAAARKALKHMAPGGGDRISFQSGEGIMLNFAETIVVSAFRAHAGGGASDAKGLRNAMRKYHTGIVRRAAIHAANVVQLLIAYELLGRFPGPNVEVTSREI
jgi:hypothetical protein